MLKRLTVVLFVFVLVFTACAKNSAGISPPPHHGNKAGDSTGTPFQPLDETVPPGNQSPGFFLDHWQPKSITDPPYQRKAKPDGPLDARIQVDVTHIITKVPETIYGNNANTYNTQMADQPPLVGYVKKLNPHVIRFPGGNLSNLYFWNQKPGHPPDDVPPPRAVPNADNYWYGKNKASRTMSLDNYYRFLKETNSQGVLTMNYGYARYGTSRHPVEKAAHYAADWVRYDAGRTKFWEIGNEGYGSYEAGFRIDSTQNNDGQPTVDSGRNYGEIARVFIDSMRAAARKIGVKIKIGTVLYEHKPGTAGRTAVEADWNAGYFKSAGNMADYYIVHNYYTPYEQDSSPSVILQSAQTSTDALVQWMNTTTEENGVKLKPLALTEWNIFAKGSGQKVSDIAGMHAAMTLGNLIKYQYGMACRWNLANAWDGGDDHGMFNSALDAQKVPDAPNWNPRPAFYHLYYFQKYFGGKMVWSGTQGDKALKSYASTFSSGHIGLVVANTSNTKKVFDVQFKHFKPGDRYYWHTLSGGYRNGKYSRNVRINGQGSTDHPGGPDNYDRIKAFSAATGGDTGLKLFAPPYSVLYILIDHS